MESSGAASGGGGLRTSHPDCLNCLNINWIVRTRPIKIPPLMQDTLQHALMCIEVLAVASNIIMFTCVFSCLGDKTKIYAIETLDPWNLFLRCLQIQFPGENKKL